MIRLMAVVLVGALGVAGLSAGPAGADSVRKRTVVEAQPGGAHPASRYYRRGPKVRGFVARRGGYSYSAADVINTYGNSRSIYGGANAWRLWSYDRQTEFGPFDHGFFFDSGVTLRGGNTPYPN